MAESRTIFLTQLVGDVLITSPATNDGLFWNGTKWVNLAPAAARAALGAAAAASPTITGPTISPDASLALLSAIWK